VHITDQPNLLREDPASFFWAGHSTLVNQQLGRPVRPYAQPPFVCHPDLSVLNYVFLKTRPRLPQNCQIVLSNALVHGVSKPLIEG
jgi:hypothetical protein